MKIRNEANLTVKIIVELFENIKKKEGGFKHTGCDRGTEAKTMPYSIGSPIITYKKYNTDSGIKSTIKALKGKLKALIAHACTDNVLSDSFPKNIIADTRQDGAFLPLPTSFKGVTP